ncbi:hypothetical protein [Pontibacter toksunensis]|uniref:hypothetical protein n=1 Tax=Pontibacter toksunensis TaxID=1332631 RepID=UPI00366B5762
MPQRYDKVVDCELLIAVGLVVKLLNGAVAAFFSLTINDVAIQQFTINNFKVVTALQKTGL